MINNQLIVNASWGPVLAITAANDVYGHVYVQKTAQNSTLPLTIYIFKQFKNVTNLHCESHLFYLKLWLPLAPLNKSLAVVKVRHKSIFH